MSDSFSEKTSSLFASQPLLHDQKIPNVPYWTFRFHFQNLCRDWVAKEITDFRAALTTEANKKMRTALSRFCLNEIRHVCSTNLNKKIQYVSTK